MTIVCDEDFWLVRDTDGAWRLCRPWVQRRSGGAAVDPRLYTKQEVRVLRAGERMEVRG